MLVGELVIGNEPPIRLYAQSEIPISPADIAIVKDQLAFLLAERFRPSALPARNHKMTIDEVTALSQRHRVTVLRLMRSGELHPLENRGDVRFDRAEVERLANLFPSPSGPKSTPGSKNRYIVYAADPSVD